MRSFCEMLDIVKEALLSVTENVGHFYPIDGTKTHIVYAEETEASEQPGDNKKLAQAVQGSIDLYAKPDEVEMADRIQEALKQKGISFSLNAALADDEQKSEFIHYEWIFEVT